MQVLESSQDRLVLRSHRRVRFIQIVLLGGLGYGLYLVGASPESFDGPGQRALVGVIYAGLLGVIWWGFPIVTLAMDRTTDTVALAEDRLIWRRVKAFRLGDLEGARVSSEWLGNDGRSRRPVLIIGGKATPIEPFAGPRSKDEAVDAINEWLARPDAPAG